MQQGYMQMNGQRPQQFQQQQFQQQQFQQPGSMYMMNPGATAQQTVLQSPNPIHKSNSGKGLMPGHDLFKRSQSMSAVPPSMHRSASDNGSLYPSYQSTTVTTNFPGTEW